MGRACVVLDGQTLLLEISRGLGFSAAERSENLRRGAEIAKLLNDAGLICISAFVAPSDEARRRAAVAVGAERFLTVHLSAPATVCLARDTSGLYTAADNGEVANIPGISSAYEAPESPDSPPPTDTNGCRRERGRRDGDGARPWCDRLMAAQGEMAWF